MRVQIRTKQTSYPQLRPCSFSWPRGNPETPLKRTRKAANSVLNIAAILEITASHVTAIYERRSRDENSATTTKTSRSKVLITVKVKNIKTIHTLEEYCTQNGSNFTVICSQLNVMLAPTITS